MPERKDFYTKEQRAAYMREYRKNNPEYRKRQAETLRQWRRNNPERMLELSRKRRKNNRELLNKYQREWAKNHRESVNATKRKWYKAHPEVRKAHLASIYLKLGEKCKICGSTENLQKHHPNYDKPKEITTLCKSCHQKLHKITVVTKT